MIGTKHVSPNPDQNPDQEGTETVEMRPEDLIEETPAPTGIYNTLLIINKDMLLKVVLSPDLVHVPDRKLTPIEVIGSNRSKVNSVQT